MLNSILSAATALALLLLFLRKSGLQMQYLRRQAGQQEGELKDFLFFDWQDAEERALRWKAFLLFPMLYPISLDDEQAALNELKASIKRTHIGIYFCLIIFIVLGILTDGSAGLS